MGRILIALKDVNSLVFGKASFFHVPTCGPTRIISTANYNSACAVNCLCRQMSKANVRRTKHFTTTVSALGVRGSNPFGNGGRSIIRYVRATRRVFWNRCYCFASIPFILGSSVPMFSGVFFTFHLFALLLSPGDNEGELRPG